MCVCVCWYGIRKPFLKQYSVVDLDPLWDTLDAEIKTSSPEKTDPSKALACKACTRSKYTSRACFTYSQELCLSDFSTPCSSFNCFFHQFSLKATRRTWHINSGWDYFFNLWFAPGRLGLNESTSSVDVISLVLLL